MDGRPFHLLLEEECFASLNIWKYDVTARFQVSSAHLHVFVHVLGGLNQAQCLIHRVTHRLIVICH